VVSNEYIALSFWCVSFLAELVVKIVHFIVILKVNKNKIPANYFL